jgi:ATP-binding cassette, subfamily A (ABC1), member 3
MASSPLRRFILQTWALTKKNLLIAAVRHPVSTFFRAVALPIAFLVLVLEVRTFLLPSSTYGISTPHSVQPLDSTLLGGQPLVVVVPPGLGSDIDDVVHAINASLSDVPEQLLYLHNETDLLKHCHVNIHGTSGCFAAVVFNDSPRTTGGSQTWSYTIRTDPIQNGFPFSALSSNNQQDALFFPLQLAIENAMTNSSIVPDIYLFTEEMQEQNDIDYRQHWLSLVMGEYSIALFIAMMSAVFHVVSMMSSERHAGMSQLIDVMGGSAAARVLSYVLAFDLLYLPCWIVSGVCKSSN